MNDNVFGAGQAPSSEEQVPVGNLSYEQARDALVETVKLLELGQMSLDESLALWERGEALARRCEEHLTGARAKVEAALASKNQDAAASAENGSGEE
ncbi:exodeoxyribonuclease VII small subunit [Corynebacterium amycolatum]|uniref:exodeoxyribonuclease VII small subunit n=1 Tax=Corynebacterium amycolatum TaxID=43765 RepID=UPI001245D7C2|nr:exodeoxyribonuclease VII small subunit [Corynebacterium amycolatum]KAA9225096.1 exodeoxyribonuclease VII small subunit [Corynebacterium amycolatum]MDK6442879.1 exodeoxyribonuclease VII small subunit [Corynebacterium amycolatum]